MKILLVISQLLIKVAAAISIALLSLACVGDLTGLITIWNQPPFYVSFPLIIVTARYMAGGKCPLTTLFLKLKKKC